MRGISVIIPTYNGLELLRANLPGVAAACAAYPGESELILVDDGGSDDTAAFAAGFPNARVVRRGVNGGFARAANDGIRAAAHPLVLLLNNDMSVSPEVLVELAGCFSAPDVFAVQARIISGAENEAADYVGRTSHKFGILKYEYRSEELGGMPVEAGFVSAGAAMFARDKFLALGLFDEVFSPFYFEDIDASLRARRAGWRVLYHPGASVRHLHAGSTVRSNYSVPRYEFIHRRNYFRLLLRHSRPCAIPLLLPYAVLRTIRGGLPEAAGSLRALLDAARGIFSRPLPLAGNVLYLDTPLASPGGGQVSLLNIVRNIRTRRPFVALSCGSSLTADLREAGVPWFIVRSSKVNVPAFALRILDAFRLARPEIVHCNSGTSFFAFVFALFARAFRVPFVWHNRVLETAGFKERLMARLAARVIVISDAVGKKFEWLPPGKVVRLYNAVDLDVFFPRPPAGGARSALGLPPDGAVIGMFSRMDAWKGHELLFSAAARCGGDSVLLLVGDGPERARLQALALSSGLSARTVFAGYRKDIAGLMNVCDVVVNPSVEPEPFGRTIIEAMACGKPVIATNMGGPLEIISDGKDGLLVGPDAGELAAGLRTLLADEARRKDMGAAARRKAEALFALGAQLETLESVYREVSVP